MMLKRAVLFALCLAMLICAFASCAKDVAQGSVEQKTDASTELTEETVDPNYVEDLPERDFTGWEFKMYMRDSDFFIKDMYVDSYENATNFVEQALYNRNQEVSERFGGVDIMVGRAPGSNTDTSLMSSILAGTCDWDVIISHGHSMTQYAEADLLENFYDIPYLDLTKHYWDQNMISEFTLKNQLYILSGDISYLLLGSTDSMVFNKGVCNDLGLDYPYEAVLNGTWTFEMFSEMIKKASGDKDGVEGLNPETGDLMGYITDDYCGPVNALYSGGGRVSQNDGETYTLTLYNSYHDTIFQKYFELVEQDNCKLYTDKRDIPQMAEIRRTFANGNVLFMDVRTYEISTLIQEGMMDYGVLPWPKWDETVNGYHSWADAGTNIMGIPKGTNGRTDERYEFIGIMLEALCAEGSRSVMPVYYEQILKLKYSQDPQSHEIMDLIKAGRVYDMASYFRSPVGNVGHALAFYSGHNFTTWWNANRSAAESHAKILNDFFEKHANP